MIVAEGMEGGNGLTERCLWEVVDDGDADTLFEPPIGSVSFRPQCAWRRVAVFQGLGRLLRKYGPRRYACTP